MAKFRCRKSPFLHPLSTKSHSEIFTSRTFIAEEFFDALQNFQSKYLSLYFFPQLDLIIFFIKCRYILKEI